MPRRDVVVAKMGAAASAQPELAGLSAETKTALEGLPEEAKTELLNALKKEAASKGSAEDAAAAKMQAMQRGNATRKAADISKWGKAVFAQVCAWLASIVVRAHLLSAAACILAPLHHVTVPFVVTHICSCSCLP